MVTSHVLINPHAGRMVDDHEPAIILHNSNMCMTLHRLEAIIIVSVTVCVCVQTHMKVHMHVLCMCVQVEHSILY